MKAIPVVALVLGAGSSACSPATPEAVHATSNAEVPVERLFTHEGCTVYRFFDRGYHYYVRCDGTATSTASPNGCGKNCEETVPTVVGQ